MPRAYRVEDDPFATWADEQLRFDQPDATTSMSDLHADYAKWAGRISWRGVRIVGLTGY